MFGIGMPELLLILAVALIILGPKKLPEIARSLGKAMGEFKRATNDLKQTIEHESGLNDVHEELRQTQDDLKRTIDVQEHHPEAEPTRSEVEESASPAGDPAEYGPDSAEPSPTVHGVTEHDKPKGNGAL